jgi:hypothetical protein
MPSCCGEEPRGSGLKTCKMASFPVVYTQKGDKFKAVVFGMMAEDEVDVGQAAQFVCHTVPWSATGNPLVGCEGFMGADGINVREMQVEFITPTSEDIGIDFECGEKWADMSIEEKQELLDDIQANLIDYVERRAYIQNHSSYEASVTIADTYLQTSGGGKVQFGNVPGAAQTGIPTIQQGLESLSIKVDGNGIKLTIAVGTRKKLQGLKDANPNLWRDMNPRVLNQMQLNNPGGN